MHLQETSPRAHEAIAHLPPPDYERIGSAVLQLAHNSTVLQSGMNDFASYDRVPPSQHTPEQAQAHSEVTELMASASGYLAVAHQEVEATKQADAAEDDIYQRDKVIFSKAKEIALADAVTAHEKGEAESAETAVKSVFALSMIEGSQNDSSHEIRELVAVGMADTVVDAATKMHGVVSLNGFMGPKPVWEEYGRTTSLLQMASEKTFDDQVQHVTPLSEVGESEKATVLAELQTQLAPQDNIALAKLEMNVHNKPELAMKNVVVATEKLLNHSGEQTAPSDIVELVRLSGESAQRLQTTEASTANQDITNKLRSRRSAGYDGQYRHNDPMSIAIDRAMVQLAAEGDEISVNALVSSSLQEAANIEWPMQLAGLSGQQADEVTALVNRCSAEKRATLQQELAEKGLSDELRDKIVHSSDPDDMVHVPQEFWQEYTANKSKYVEELLFGPSAGDQVNRANNILGLVGAGIEYGKIETHMIPRMSSLTGEQRESYLTSVAAFVEDIKASLPDEQAELPSGVLNRSLELFQPNEALAHAKWLYGDKAVAELPATITLLTQHQFNPDSLLAFDKKTLDKINAIKGAEGDIINSLDQEARIRSITYALGEDDPVKALQEIMELRESAAFITNEVRTYGEGENAKDYSLDIALEAHPKEWMRLMRGLPGGRDGESMKKMILDRLYLPIRMANLKEGAFKFSEHPVESIRMFTEIAPTPANEINSTLNPLQVELLRMFVVADTSTAMRGENNRITGFRGFPSTRPTILKEVFYTDEFATMYQELTEARKQGDTALQQYLEQHPGLREPPAMKRSLPNVVAQLRLSTPHYRREQLDAAIWIKKFAKEPVATSKILAAWESRAMALTYRDDENPTERVADNPNDILDFMAVHGLRILMQTKTEAGEKTITNEQLASFKPWIEAIGSRYAVKRTLSMLERVAATREANGPYPAKVLGANAMTVTTQELWQAKQPDATYKEVIKERTLSAEILAGDDPGGFTIGYDTGCCMRLGGAAETCVWAGYEDPRYSFFTIRDDGGRLRAQSILYVTEYMGKNYLVADNIETNGGTDVEVIEKVYRQALVQFVQQQELDIEAIHVGIGYLQGGILKDLPAAKVVPPTPRIGTYSDAAKQKVLWEKSSE